MTEKWAAIIYGRTYELDFRLLAIPKDFNENEKKEVEKLINSTTKEPEKLQDNPRWCLWKTKNYCIVGITSRVKELLASEITSAQQYTQDQHNRTLYVFVGYVARPKNDGGFPPIPAYSYKDLSLFKPLYDLVRQRWQEKSYNKTVHLSNYESINYLSVNINLLTENDGDFSSTKPNQINQIFSNTLEEREKVWLKASKKIQINNDTAFSLCLESNSYRYSQSSLSDNNEQSTSEHNSTQQENTNNTSISQIHQNKKPRKLFLRIASGIKGILSRDINKELSKLRSLLSKSPKQPPQSQPNTDMNFQLKPTSKEQSSNSTQKKDPFSL
ncbi:MAG: hypothetical protein EA365_08885 [Gloeocapsa sp. DLM2.Bin57]|nr:MAG: hypothetical protein EA365_08885 [Gloeocapsa sp. DLM2.Bin57]